MTFGPPNTQSPYIATSRVFSEDPKQLTYNLNESYTQIANAVNIREISIYPVTLEVVTGQLFSDPNNAQRYRPVFRSTYYFGAIAAGTSLTVATTITNVTSFTHIYGTVITAVPDYRPIAYASNSSATDQIAVKVVISGSILSYVIAVGAGHPDVTSGILILEYLKS